MRRIIRRLIKATISDGTNDVDIVTHEGENSLRVVLGRKAQFVVHVTEENIAADLGISIVDLSDTVNWPHTETGHIILDRLWINVNPSTAFRGDIEFGFLSNVDATNGDLNKIYTVHMDQSAAEVTQQLDFDGIGLDLESGEFFGPITTNDTTWQTDVNLVGPDGGAAAYPAGDGDFVCKINRTAGNVDMSTMAVYSTVA